MRQCTMTKDNMTQTAWIANEYARVGKVIKIKTNGIWDDGWTVTEVGKLDVSYNAALDRSRDYTRTRKASDI